MILSKLYIVRFLHQTTTGFILLLYTISCISSVSYIKPQLINKLTWLLPSCISSVSYIKPQPCQLQNQTAHCCISSVSYIKPQPISSGTSKARSCISSVSYIKPQLYNFWKNSSHVVYRPFPTSNHNLLWGSRPIWPLYIVRFLHQTTTYGKDARKFPLLYIVRFLHQTTTLRLPIHVLEKLYIVRFLHQTTTIV